MEAGFRVVVEIPCHSLNEKAREVQDATSVYAIVYSVLVQSQIYIKKKITDIKMNHNNVITSNPKTDGCMCDIW